MKKQTINFSWPAILSDFTKDEKQENFSRGKLKVFYKGETADHRYFSDGFAEEIVKTLPYTPVVSYYNEEEEDFEGHACEQNIYGIVDPCSDVVFEELEDGKTWCICDVVLYTERPDKTGDIAKKIVGQPHSLELNPKTVKYVINYDEKKHFKNIEFTAGDFVGVSVLGKNQKPAFTGSAFFSCDETFNAKMKLLKDYCESKTGQEYGGEQMDLKEFMTLSWGEVSTKVDSAIYDEYKNDAYTYIVDMYADYAIARFYYYMESASRLMKVYYSVDEQGNVTLGGIKEVHIVYEEVEETNAEINMKQIDETSIDAENSLDNTDDFTDDSQEDEKDTVENDAIVNEEVVTDASSNEPEDFVEENNEPSNEEDQTETEDPEITTETIVTVDQAQVSNVEITPTQTEASVENEQINNEQETNSSATSLTESERQEFETLKREKKINLINSYKESLTEDEFNDFITRVDSFTDESLELELLKAYKRNQTEDSTGKQRRVFAFTPINANNNNESPLDAFVSKYKK